MTTIASPRAGPLHSPSVPPPSPSLPSTTTSRTASPAGRASTLPQRHPNRAALRDYYNLKTAAPADIGNRTRHEESESKESELDGEGFDAEGYVKAVLAGQGLEGVLRVEGGLVNEIKGLDGERKALVYDNYSKLITATDTIKKMRTNMDPLTPTTSTLSPAIAHIAETASSLAAAAPKKVANQSETDLEAKKEAMTVKRKQQETVRWVLDAPGRLGTFLDAGSKLEAEKDWTEVKGFLEKWQGVNGAQEVREECEKTMERK